MGTFIEEKPSTWGEWFTDLYDVFDTELANWSIIDEDAVEPVGSPQQQTGWFIVEHTQSSIDNFRFYWHDESGSGEYSRLRIWYGDWAAGGGWNESYNSPDDRGRLTAHKSGGVMYNDDPIEYSMQYDDEGLVFGIRRKVGDGEDGALVFGFAEIQPIWDYQSADSDERLYCWMMYTRSNGGAERYNYVLARGRWQQRLNAEDNWVPGQLFKNPDRDFPASAVYTEPVMYSDQYTEANGDIMPIGTHDFWLEAAFGDRAYGDTIEVGGTPTYYLFDWDVAYVAIRMT